MQDKPCKDHPDAPHGFDRNASHNADRYVCECESWEPPKREWVGLTDDAVFELADTNLYDGGKNYGVLAFAKAIEQALKEKNR
jgi:hypothetical protein